MVSLLLNLNILLIVDVTPIFNFSSTASMLDSSEDTDCLKDIALTDLEAKIRRYTEETANLKDELLRAEDTIATLERDLKLAQKTLYVVKV